MIFEIVNLLITGRCVKMANFINGDTVYKHNDGSREGSEKVSREEFEENKNVKLKNQSIRSLDFGDG